MTTAKQSSQVFAVVREYTVHVFNDISSFCCRVCLLYRYLLQSRFITVLQSSIVDMYRNAKPLRVVLTTWWGG